MYAFLLSLVLIVGALLLLQLLVFAFILSKEAMGPKETKAAVARSKTNKGENSSIWHQPQ